MKVSKKIKEIKKVEKENEKEWKIVVVKVKDREGKIEVMKKKIALRGKMVRIEDD